jgi:regulatory protein YycI of two-component signal transduction system YycFG
MNKVLILFLGLLTSFTLHKYYVSVTEISYNQKSEQLEISLKVFNDDWQNALDHRLGQPVKLGSKNEYPKLDSLVSAYLFDGFSVKVNEEQKKLHIIGSEIEGEATWIYMYVDEVKDVKSIEIHNKILTEMFDEQRNVVQLTFGKINRSALLTKSRSSKVFVFD